MEETTTGLTNTSPNAKPAGPQQQAQFDLLLGRCRQVMGDNAKEWLQTLKAMPVDGAVTLGTSTLRQLAQMSEKAGQEVDPVVLIHVGVQLVKDVASVANAAGIVSDDELPAFLKDVMSQSMMQYLKDDADDGLLSPDEKQMAAGVLDKAGVTPVNQGSPASQSNPGMLAQMQGGEV